MALRLRYERKRLRYERKISLGREKKGWVWSREQENNGVKWVAPGAVDSMKGWRDLIIFNPPNGLHLLKIWMLKSWIPSACVIRNGYWYHLIGACCNTMDALKRTQGFALLPRVIMMPSSGRFGYFMGACSCSLRPRSRWTSIKVSQAPKKSALFYLQNSQRRDLICSSHLS